MRGRVKQFMKDKGYGFIHAEDGQDYFFHYSAIQAEGFKTCEEGDFCEFDIVDSEKGKKADNIKITG